MIKQEDFQNRALAHLLRERGIEADFEQRRGRRRIDVVAEVEGLRVVLEAETGYHRKAQAIKDADARLRQRLATVAFAVCYPAGVTEDSLAEATLTWTVRVKPGEPSGEWSTGGVAQLVQAVLQAPRSLSGADIAAELLSDGLDEVVQRLKATHSAGAGAGRSICPATKPRVGQQNDGYFRRSQARNARRGYGHAVPPSRTGAPAGPEPLRLRRGSGRRPAPTHCAPSQAADDQRIPRGVARHSGRGLPSRYSRPDG